MILLGYLVPRWLARPRAEALRNLIVPVLRPVARVVGVFLPARAVPGAGELRALWREGAAAGFAADEELIIGIRDHKDDTWRSGVRIYDPQNASGTEWKRTIVDPAGVAVEDLAAGDLDGDGKVDLVAVGRATKNVRIYWNQTGK